MPEALAGGDAVRVIGGRYAGFVGRLLSAPAGGAVRVAIVLFGAEHDVVVPEQDVEPTDEPIPPARVARAHDDGTVR